MSWFSGVVVFLLIWWTLLFTVLPWGNDRHDGAVTGADPGAPQTDRIRRKFIITTIISAALWIAIFLLIESDLISFRLLAQHLGVT